MKKEKIYSFDIIIVYTIVLLLLISMLIILFVLDGIKISNIHHYLIVATITIIMILSVIMVYTSYMEIDEEQEQFIIHYARKYHKSYSWKDISDIRVLDEKKFKIRNMIAFFNHNDEIFMTMSYMCIGRKKTRKKSQEIVDMMKEYVKKAHDCA